MRYIALLRGVNVGGNTMIRMEELRRTFEALRFDNVASYINSGNLAFDCTMFTGECGSNEDELMEMIESAIESEYGRPIQVIVREQWHIEKIIEADPFAGEYDSHKQMHVLFLRHELQPDQVAVLMAEQTEHERFLVRGREIYCLLKGGVAESLLGRGFIEKKLKAAYTSRNWRTVQRLATL